MLSARTVVVGWYVCNFQDDLSKVYLSAIWEETIVHTQGGRLGWGTLQSQCPFKHNVRVFWAWWTGRSKCTRRVPSVRCEPSHARQNRLTPFFRGSSLDKHIHGIKDLKVRDATSGFSISNKKNANVKWPKLRHRAGTTGEKNRKTASGDGTMSTMFVYVREDWSVIRKQRDNKRKREKKNSDQ